MKKYLFLLVCSALLFSCNDEEGPAVCGVENPVEDLAWIKSAIQEMSGPGFSEYSYLSQARYQGETVFFFGSCDPLANWALIVRDCQGNPVEGEISLTDLNGQKVIWKPSNSVCNFS